MVAGPSLPGSCFQLSEGSATKAYVGSDHGDGSETASTASSELPGSPLVFLKSSGFGGFGPGGSWFWSPHSEGTSGDSSPAARTSLDCFYTQPRSNDGEQATVESLFSSFPEAWKELRDTTAKDKVAVLRREADSEQRRSSLLSTSHINGVFTVQWRVDSKKLASRDRQAVSPPFDIQLEGQAVGSFRLLLCPCAISHERNGSCFRKAKGCGLVELKNESGEVCKPLVIQASLLSSGREEIVVKSAERVRHNFSETCVCVVSQEWDFGTAVDPASQMFLIRISVFGERQA